MMSRIYNESGTGRSKARSASLRTFTRLCAPRSDRSDLPKPETPAATSRKAALPYYVYPVLAALVCMMMMIERATGEWRAGTLTATRRVLRSDPPGSARAVELAAARNEWESFQILMRSDEPVQGVTVEPGDLVGPGEARLRAGDARLYRQHQLEITRGTYRNESFKPGWYPDPLIPFRHPQTLKPLPAARFRAVPFDLPAGQTHGFWVDIYVPDDARPGEYRGAYRVTAVDEQPADIPITLTVWNFALQRVSTLQTALGSPASRMRRYYRQRAEAGKEKQPSDWAAVESQCAELLTRHRINATLPAGSILPAAQPDGTYRIPDRQVEALRRFVDRNHVNAVQVPHPRRVIEDPDKEREKLHAWLKAWDQAATELDRPYVTFYIYLRDEPNDEDAYRYVQKWGRAIRQAGSVVKVMVVEQTWTEKDQGGADSAWGNLYGAVDIWCPLFCLFRPDSAAKRQALGETIWTYTALCQQEPTPWWHIDYPLLNYRVPAWIAWRYRIRGLLYWGGMSHWRQVDDPWTQPGTYYGRGSYQHGRPGRVYNGEGTLVYPARAVGYDGIVPSLRLKALRDGIEDYEYLAILERAGRAAEAREVIVPLAPSWFQWEKNPRDYERARARLAELILSDK